MKTTEEAEKLIKYIDQNVVGKDQTFSGPFGRRKIVYCDFTASARSLLFIEEYILKEVLPLYGNTHISATVTSLQSTLFREEARNIFRKAVNASEDDVVLFAGGGCVGGINKLIHALNLTAPPIVFVGSCEHNSNLRPWRELGSKIVRISETKEGMLDLIDLQKKIELHRDTLTKEIMIGCFSASSNITGILADDIATTILLHQYGALAFWDYSAAAPYVNLDMNPLVPGIDQLTSHKDAIFFSGHKFIGGVQSPGILVTKKSLFANNPFHCCGNGSVQSSGEDNCCLETEELREESGTPAIVESVRAGLAMHLKQAVGVPAIMDCHDNMVKTVVSFMRKIPEIILLGSTSQNVKRLAVFSIMVRHPRGSYLHHNFICAVLNDVFGIQARGGCACAGSYAQDLMGIGQDLASHYEEVLMEESAPHEHDISQKDRSDYEMLRPGFTRISFPFFMSELEVGFVLEAVKMVATEGWKLLPQYILNPKTGEWHHCSNMNFRERKWLSNIKYTDGKMTVAERKLSSVGPCPSDFNECLKTARCIFNKARKIAKRHPHADQSTSFSDDLNPLRWFMLPSEAQDLLLGQARNVKQDVPFSPTIYLGSKPHIHFSPPDLRRHFSLAVPDEIASYGNIKFSRQRSESNSPARNTSKLGPLMPSRERCYSLGSALIHDLPKCQLSRHRLLSCGSQEDNSDSQNSSPGEQDVKNELPFSRYTALDLEYVEGITKELATEIKSELREVIAQVDDALSETDHEYYNLSEKRPSIDISRLNKRKAFSLPTSNNQTTDSQDSATHHAPNSLPISAERFSEYLVGFASEVVSEMKSEFRDVVNAVEGIMSPATDGVKGCPTKQNSLSENSKEFDSLSALRNCKLEEDIKKLQSSHDSGINLTERDSSPIEQHEVSIKLNLKPKLKVKIEDERSANDEVSKKTTDESTKWCYPSKNIWRPTCEAVREWNMIRNGDKVLVCLSGGINSFILLHALHQYQYYATSKGIKFKIGAATVDPGDGTYNPKPLISYFQNLDIDYFYEETDGKVKVDTKEDFNPSHTKKGKLYSVARSKGYTVLALDQTLDDVLESFLTSAFHNGFLKSLKAHYLIKEGDIRVIRPFIYVRQRALTYYANVTYFPENSSSSPKMSKGRRKMKQLLAQQEAVFPYLFRSLKSAIKPLIQCGAENVPYMS